ncbi:MAG TPA: stage III sporulation protein AA, partial [Mobilitalea sp.]|nr:stage III sporulation protein AA [Mobilitalea sp.]
DRVLPYLIDEKQRGIYHTLIISPPRCGKTTLLRDIIRQLSDGSKYLSGMSVGVVDERSEIGACYMGVPQNELGIRTDILDCCPKAKGMLMLIRSMSPQIIAVDEIGSREDLEAIDYVIGCGCKLIATVHGSSIEDIRSKPILSELVQKKLFERYIILSNGTGIGHLEEIYDASGKRLYTV